MIHLLFSPNSLIVKLFIFYNDKREGVRINTNTIKNQDFSEQDVQKDQAKVRSRHETGMGGFAWPKNVNL